MNSAAAQFDAYVFLTVFFGGIIGIALLWLLFPIGAKSNSKNIIFTFLYSFINGIATGWLLLFGLIMSFDSPHTYNESSNLIVPLITGFILTTFPVAIILKFITYLIYRAKAR